jgi:acyl transferase domain-containing protein/acyl carrier protein
VPNDPKQSENRERLKSAVLAIKTLQTRLASAESSMREPIAVIGMGCRFPGGAIDPESYWQLLRDGRDGMGEIPGWRWPVEEFYSADPNAPGKMYVRRAGFVEGIENFDADFFGIAAREALRLDPQQRLLLEVAWEALEDAGVAPNGLAGSSTGVFVGITYSDYGEVLHDAGGEYIDTYHMTGSCLNFAPGRIAYYLGLQGPALAIDSACSSSLVAVDTACRSLRTRQCDLALSCGVNAMLSPEAFVTRCKARMLSADGVCRTFDASASGFARGEGAGVVVLKRLTDAQADGDRILAVILGSAVNQDGKTSGLTVPNRHAQEAVIRKALGFAGVATTDIQYIEAHGTATPLGDPIEVRALANVLGPSRSPANPFYLGSVKTNIGHLESAAGIAGLLKVIQALRHREIPPHLNLQNLTPHVQWDQIPVRVPTSLTPWPEAPRRLAGVSSFGASGTNAHVVVAEAPEPPAPTAEPGRPMHLLTVSARTDSALRSAAARLADYLATQPEAAIEDVCHTMNAGRAHFGHRVSVLCCGTAEAREKLLACFSSLLPAGVRVSHSSGGQRQPATKSGVAGLPAPGANHEDWAEALKNLQAQYHGGDPIDWKEFGRRFPGGTRSLPTYPFERERFWVEPERGMRSAAGRGHTAAATNAHPLLGVRLDSPAIEGSVFEAQLNAQDPAFLQDHQICGRAILPSTAYVEMGLAGAHQLFGDTPYRLEDLALQEALPLVADTSTKVQLILRGTGGETSSFEVYSASEDREDAAITWTRHAIGKLVRSAAGVEHVVKRDLAAIRARCTKRTDVQAFYTRLREQGAEFGPAFRNLRTILQGNDESLAEIRLAEGFDSTSARYHVHPALLDACFQAAAASMVSGSAADEVLLPVGIERVQVPGKVPDALWSHSRMRETAGNEARTSVFDLQMFDQGGQAIGTVSGLTLQWVKRSALGGSRSADAADWLYEIQWRKMPMASKTLSASADGLGRPGSWLILADQLGLGEALRTRLSGLGHNCILARSGTAFAAHGDNTFAVNPASTADFARLMAGSGITAERPLCGVLHLWSLEAAASDGMTGSDLDRAQLLSCGAALHLVQAIVSSKANSPPRLYLVTRGAQAAAQSVRVASETAAVWGLARVIAAEHPELHCRRIDLDPENSGFERDAALLMEALRDESAEDEIAVRGDAFFAPRLARLPSPIAAKDSQPSSQPVRLEISQAGLLENLSWVRSERAAPEFGEVEIEVRVAGLNFRDVLCALGMYPGHVERFGGECAGVVTRTGDGVKKPRPGDVVMALAPGSLGSHANVRADYVAPLPAGIGVAEAASLPVVFLTTLYGLHRLGRMKSGDRVLIHAAAGGVGLAAVQLAQRAGAEVFATAGSRDKRDYLQGLGVSHIYDSRSLDFAGEIMRDSNGRGVDIVLNSLAGEFIAKSVSVLAPGGRFLELGKRGILTRDEFIAKRPDCEYFAYDLGEEALKDPSLVPALFAELLRAFEQGALRPLPTKVFEAVRIVEAFRFMSQAKHIGKIVIDGPARGSASAGAQSPAKFHVHGDATYMITGGLSGLGLEGARWLFREGARNLALIGRSEPGPETRAILDELTDAGVKLAVETCDVSDEPQLVAAFARIARSMPPLRGIIHAAGVLDDGVLTEQSWPRFERVMAPKVGGAWNLHRLTRSSNLDFFVLFASAAGMIGLPGQGNYAAANAFMDALAQQRRAMGLAALSVDWGTWAEVGMAARLKSQDAQRWSERGLRLIGLEEGMAKLGEMIGLGRPQIAAIPVDWGRFLRAPGIGRSPAFFAEVAEVPSMQARAATPAEPANDLVPRILAEPAVRRLPVLQTHVESVARRALGVREGKAVDPRQPLHQMGLDSLMSVELRNALAASLGRPLPATLLFDYPTVESLTQYLAKDVLHLEAAPAAGGESAEEKSHGLSELENLTEAEAEALLVAELDKTKEFAK